MPLRRAILFVKDVEAMTAFYRDGLGLTFQPDASAPGWVEFDGLALHAIPAAIAAGITIAKPPVAREDAPIKLAFSVADVGAARAKLTAQGAVMFEARAWGCDGLDPEGNVFQIVKS